MHVFFNFPSSSLSFVALWYLFCAVTHVTFFTHISVLEDEERTLVEENIELFETHSEAILKLLHQDDYKRKFNVLTETNRLLEATKH